MRRRTCTAVVFLSAMLLASTARATQNYHATISEVVSYKGILDDPAPFYTDSQYYKVFIPDDVWAQITFDPAESRAAWEKAVGLR
ncbi:MAG: hypothetical protein ACWGSD_02685, partial [Thermodesulfobacteriota bacterium]